MNSYLYQYSVHLINKNVSPPRLTQIHIICTNTVYNTYTHKQKCKLSLALTNLVFRFPARPSQPAHKTPPRNWFVSTFPRQCALMVPSQFISFQKHSRMKPIINKNIILFSVRWITRDWCLLLICSILD